MSSEDADGEKKVVFLFSPPEHQDVGLAAALFKLDPVFEASIQLCDEVLKDFLPVPLGSFLCPDPELANNLFADALRITSRYTCVLAFAVQYALAKRWMKQGVEPKAVLGYGTGEYVAACISGALSLRSALELLCRREALTQ
eukprot:gene26288-32227_t